MPTLDNILAFSYILTENTYIRTGYLKRYFDKTAKLQNV